MLNGMEFQTSDKSEINFKAVMGKLSR